MKIKYSEGLIVQQLYVKQIMSICNDIIGDKIRNVEGLYKGMKDSRMKDGTKTEIGIFTIGADASRLLAIKELRKDIDDDKKWINKISTAIYQKTARDYQQIIAKFTKGT